MSQWRRTKWLRNEDTQEAKTYWHYYAWKVSRECEWQKSCSAARYRWRQSCYVACFFRVWVKVWHQVKMRVHYAVTANLLKQNAISLRNEDEHNRKHGKETRHVKKLSSNPVIFPSLIERHKRESNYPLVIWGKCVHKCAWRIIFAVKRGELLGVGLGSH